MKTKSTFLRVLIVAIMVAVMSGCAKERLSPVSEMQQTANSVLLAANTSDAPDSLTVSTFYKFIELLPPNRIGSAANQSLYVTTSRRNSQSSVIKINPQGVGTTLATGFQYAIGVKAASDGNVYVADFWANEKQSEGLITRISPTGIKSIVTAPDGSSISKRVYAPQDVAIADDNTTLYVLNTGGNTVFRINSEKVFDVAGVLGIAEYADGIGYNARLKYPTAMKLSKNGNIYLVDDSLGFADTYVNITTADGRQFQGTGGRSIRRLNLATRQLTTIYRATGNRHIMDITVAKKDQNFKTSNTEGVFAVFSDNTISYINSAGVEIPLTSAATQGNLNGSLRNAKFGFLTGISIHENFMDVVDMSNLSIKRIIRKK